MHRKLLPLLLLSTVILIVRAQPDAQQADSLTATLHTFRQSTSRHTAFWGIDLYGPLLLVDPETRTVYANESDSTGLLRPAGALYFGQLPDSLPLANTAVRWNGRTWAMVLLPLPDNPTDRTVLLAHELFHRAQPELRFVIAGSNNAHLDTEAGRVLLRLELEALKRALRAPTPDERYMHLTRALAFRSERHRRFPGAAESEHTIERNEGLAEYTGQAVAGMPAEQAFAYATARIDALLASPTFVRSFAYATLPAYGRMAADSTPDWHRAVTSNTPLTDYLIRLFGITLPDSLPTSWVTAYGGETIAREESVRAAHNRAMRDSLRARLVEGPHLTLPLRQMQFTFDPRNVVPLDSLGTVYPQLRLTDVWGTLNVTDGGALISSDRLTITVSDPRTTSPIEAHGPGWHLSLTSGYRLIKRADNYVVEGEERP